MIKENDETSQHEKLFITFLPIKLYKKILFLRKNIKLELKRRNQNPCI